jgi:serine/threonine protein phosphatase PrpC
MGQAEPAMQLEIGQFSHRGQCRPNNEDWLGTFQPDDATRLARKGCLFLVADGLGGHQGGELASRQAVDQVIRGYVEDPAADVTASLRRAIEAANASLYARSAPAGGRLRSGTTLVAAVVRGAELWTANVGDSRAYLLRSGKLSQLTRDHALFSAEGHQVPLAGERLGQHLITRALGTRPSVEVDLSPPQKLHAGDRILLCSDGLTTPLCDEEIRKIMAAQPPQETAEALVQAANERGGPDNVSVIVIQVVGQAPAQAPGQVLRFETWRETLKDLSRFLPGRGQGPWSPLLLVTILLAALALIGLGFVLGLIIF